MTMEVPEPEPTASAGWYPDQSVPGQLRFWNGAEWTAETKVVTPDDRRAALDRSVATCVSNGYRVESRTDYQAVLAIGQETNHILHFLITAFTCGLWGFMWLMIALTNKVTRTVVSVDEYGHVLYQ